MKSNKLPARSSSADVQEFLSKVAAIPKAGASGTRGRVIFAMDATASREASWDQASNLQAEMFQETAAKGGLEVQLAYFRGFGEFNVSNWTNEPQDLLSIMTAVSCRAGETQIKKVLLHTLAETKKHSVDALIFIGDSMEEDIDRLGAVSGELGLLGVPAFIFQEGNNSIAEFAFRQISKLTNGAYCRLDVNSAQTLRQLLRAVANYAVGGRLLLEDMAKKEGGAILKIAKQLSK